MNAVSGNEGRPSFDAVYTQLKAQGPGRATSRLGTEYAITGEVVKGRQVIIARPRRGRVTVHEDCWGEDITCQRTRAGGIYNGPYSIYDWFWSNA